MMKALQNSKVKNKTFYLALLFLTFFCNSFASSLIRDAETEDYLREILDEILIASEIKPTSVNLFLIQDNEVNAFVFGGSNIFVNTGLIQSFNTYKPIQAVLAHEVGHIKGFHIIKFYAGIDKTISEALFYSLSGAFIVATGGIGASLLVGLSLGLNTLEKRVLSFSRMQENEADYYAFQVLTKLKSSKEGTVEVFTKFAKMQDLLISPNLAEGYKYNVTHPFPRQRLEFFENKFSKINYVPITSEKFNKTHSRINAKLGGFFGNININYDTTFLQNELDKMYFLAFSFIKKGELKKAEGVLSLMLLKEPKNPYIYEILSEINYKNQKYEEALNFIQKALQIKPNSFLFLLHRAEVYTALKQYDLAIKTLNQAQKIEPFNPKIPFNLASIYSITKEDALARLYFIESEILRQNYAKAKALFSFFKSQNYKLEPPFDSKAQDIEYFLRQK